MRSIGLDAHRDFCEVAISEGGKTRSAGRVETALQRLELFARSLGRDDRVVLEATGNALAIVQILEPHVGEVVVAHSKQLRAITHAKVKSDKVDARMLAELLAADLIPAVWVGDERTRVLRRRVSRRRARSAVRRNTEQWIGRRLARRSRHDAGKRPRRSPLVSACGIGRRANTMPSLSVLGPWLRPVVPGGGWLGASACARPPRGPWS